MKILTYFASLLLRLLDLSLSYEFRGLEVLDEIEQQIGFRSFIFAVWHQYTIVGLLSARRFPIVIIVSQSKDGELIAQVSHFLGARTVRGSSTRGGKQAKEKLLDHLSNRTGVGAITVDGPRGPSHQPKAGIIDIAKQAGVPIVPYVPVAQKNWVFRKSWDKFHFPKPFSKVIIQLGKPIWIKSDTPYEEYDKYKKLLKDTLENIESQIDFD